MGAGHLSAGSHGHYFPLRAPLPPAVCRTLCRDVGRGGLESGQEGRLREVGVPYPPGKLWGPLLLKPLRIL